MSDLLSKIEKGTRVTLDFADFKLGLGWDPDESRSQFDFDLDVSAFLLGKNKKIITDDYLVFYNSEKRVLPDKLTALEPENPSKYPPYVDEDGKNVSSHDHWRQKTRPIDPEFSVIGSIDDMSGTTSDEGDDETMDVNLSKVRPEVEEIIVVVSIYEYQKRKQNFGQVDNAYVRIYKPATPDRNISTNSAKIFQPAHQLNFVEFTDTTANGNCKHLALDITEEKN